MLEVFKAFWQPWLEGFKSRKVKYQETWFDQTAYDSGCWWSNKLHKFWPKIKT